MRKTWALFRFVPHPPDLPHPSMAASRETLSQLCGHTQDFAMEFVLSPLKTNRFQAPLFFNNSYFKTPSWFLSCHLEPKQSWLKGFTKPIHTTCILSFTFTCSFKASHRKGGERTSGRWDGGIWSERSWLSPSEHQGTRCTRQKNKPVNSEIRPPAHCCLCVRPSAIWEGRDVSHSPGKPTSVVPRATFYNQWWWKLRLRD